MWKCSHNPFTGTVTAKTCRDQEVRKVSRCFDVSIDIGEVAVLAIEMSKEEETWRRGTMGMTPHPIATNNIVDLVAEDAGFQNKTVQNFAYARGLATICSLFLLSLALVPRVSSK